MSTASLAAVDFFHNEIAAEVNAGFPTLQRVPDTLVFKFIDYVGNLAGGERAELLPILARKAALHVFSDLAGEGMPALMANPVYQRFVQAWSGGLAGGLRYTPIHLLAGIAKDKSVGGLEGWCEKMGFTGRVMQPPQGFPIDIANIQPVKIPALRKRVEAALKTLFAKAAQTKTPQDKPEEPGGGLTFLSLARAQSAAHQGVVAGSRLRVFVEYGNKYAFHQAKYVVNLHHPGRSLKVPYVSYEGLWTAGTGSWNYISEEGVPRAVDLLCELLTYLAELPDRLPEECFRR